MSAARFESGRSLFWIHHMGDEPMFLQQTRASESWVGPGESDSR